MKNNVAILINSCDAYIDVVNLNLHALKEFWPELNFPVYLNTESSNFKSDLFEIINLNAKDSEYFNWGSRFRASLLNIKEEFVITLLDDFILENYVNAEMINKIISSMQVNSNFDCYYLEYAKHHMIYDKVIGFYRLENTNYYLVNTGPAIWRKETLLRLVEPGDNPWAWEFFAMYRKSAKGLNIFGVSSEIDNIFNYDNRMGGAIYRGKWVYNVVFNKLMKYNLSINLSERGIVYSNESIPRSFQWKLYFIYIGYKMVGIKSYHALIHILRVKFLKKSLI